MPLIRNQENQNPGEVAVQPARRRTACQRFCTGFKKVLLSPCTLAKKYCVVCSHAANEMFEQKEFRCKFPTVLADTVFQWASHSFLILSVFEIRDTPADFPFGPDENNKPLEVNQRIKTASLVLLCIYMGLASLAMMLSLAFMAWEDQQRRQNWRTRKCSSFKKALMIFFFGPLHLNMLA